MKKIYTISLFCAICLSIGINRVEAQTILEAGRYSRQTNMGSARATAMGGAFTALGGEVSGITKNPAGVGVFRNTEITLTLNPTVSKSSSYANFIENGFPNSTTSKASRTSFQMDNLGLVLAFKISDDAPLRYFNVGIAYTNTNNFNLETNRLVPTSPTSMTHVWAEQSAGIEPDYLNSLGGQLAYNTYLINPNGDGGYFSVLDYSVDGTPVTDAVSQNEKVREKGYQGSYTVSLGANISDKWYVGLGISAQQLSYRHTSLYREAAALNAPSGLDYYDYHTWEHNDAVGAQFSFGLIYRPTNAIRLGASIHTPTWWEVNYDADAYIDAFYNNERDETIGRDGDWFSDTSPLTSYHYSMRTAWRADLGAAVVIGKRLIISADAEYIAYSKAKYSESGDDFYNFEPLYGELNSAIRSTYASKWNYAVGAEFKLTRNFSLRYGYNLNATPYRNAEESDLKQHNCGIGWSKEWAMIDFSYSNCKYNNTTQFYNWGEYASIPVTNEYQRHIMKLTLGAKF